MFVRVYSANPHVIGLATCGPVLAHAKSRGPELSEKELGFGQIVFVKLSNSYQNPFKLGFRF